jgi:hypothetical protein
LATATFETLTESTEVIRGDKMLEPIIWQTMSAYLHPDFTDKDITNFIKEIKMVINPEDEEIEQETLTYWKSRFTSILKPFASWPTTIPKKQSQMKERYEEVTNNFSYFLHTKVNISWPAAIYYSQLMLQYFNKLTDITKGKIKIQFDLSLNKIDSIAGQLSKNFIWLDCTKTISILQSIHLFAAYLKACGNVDEKEMLRIQHDCNELYKVTYPTQQQQFVEADCFKDFPFLKVNG